MRRNTQHKEMYGQEFSGNACGKVDHVCILRMGTDTSLCVMSVGTCHACLWGKVSVCITQGKERARVCACSHLHLGEDRCKYVCDSFQVCMIRGRKYVTIYVHACTLRVSVWFHAQACVLMGRMRVRGQVMSYVCVSTAGGGGSAWHRENSEFRGGHPEVCPDIWGTETSKALRTEGSTPSISPCQGHSPILEFSGSPAHWTKPAWPAQAK